MHDAQLDAGFRIVRVDGIRGAFQTVHPGNEDIVQAPVFQFYQHVQPELYALIFGQPHPRQRFLTFNIAARRKEYRFIDNAAVLPDFQDDTVRVTMG